MRTIGGTDTGVTEGEFNEFIERLHLKMEAGAREYGDASLRRRLPNSLDEIEQELVDVCGWACIALTRLRRVKARARQLDLLADPEDTNVK